MRKVLAILVLVVGCGRGLQSDPFAGPHPDASAPADAAGPDTAPTAGPDTAPAAGPDTAPDAAPGAGQQAPPADAAPLPPDASPPDSAPPDVPTTPLALPATTVWKRCGQLGANWPHALAHSPDGKELLVGYGDGSIDRVPIAGGDSLSGDFAEGVTVKVAYAADGSLWAALDFNGLRVWGPGDNDYAQMFDFLVNARTLRFSPSDAHLILIGGEHNQQDLQLWRVGGSSGAFKLEVAAKIAGTADAAFSADGASVLYLEDQTIITVGLDGTRKGQVRLEGALTGPVFSPDASLVVGLDASGAVAAYTTSDGKRRWTRTLQGGRPARLVFALRSAKLLALGTRAAMLSVVDGTVIADVPLAQPLTEADPSPDGSELAGITGTGTLTRLSLADGSALPGPTASPVNPTDFSLLSPSPDGRYLAATGGKNVLWDLTRGAEAAVVGGEQVEFSPAGDLVAQSGSGCSIIRLDDGSSAATPPPASCDYSLVFSPDGKQLAGASDLGVAVFSTDGRVVMNIASKVRHPALRFSPDGAWLAGSGHELWSTRDWSPAWTADPALQEPPGIGFPDHASTVVFSPDGKQVLASVAYRPSGPEPTWTVTSRLFAVPGGEVVRNFQPPLARRPRFSPDGAWITAGDQVLHLATGTTRALDAGTVISAFLPDGRIAGGQSGDVVTLYCPQ